MLELVPALPHLLAVGQQPIHRPLGAEVVPGIEQGRVNLRRGEIHEPRPVEHSENRDAFRVAKRAG